MAEMKCNGGKYTVLISDEDRATLESNTWIVNRGGARRTFRVFMWIYNNGKKQGRLYLNNLILERMGIEKGKHNTIYVDNNPLNCKRDNLRICHDKPAPKPRIKSNLTPAQRSLKYYHERMQCPGYRKCMALHTQWRAKKSERYRNMRRTYQNERVKTNLYYRILSRVTGRIRAALMGREKGAGTRELLGCSINEYREYLTGLFKQGMSWDNYGKTWNIDHIRPCKSFDLSNVEEQRACFHYSNTRPEYVDTNSSKGARWNGVSYQKYNTSAMHNVNEQGRRAA